MHELRRFCVPPAMAILSTIAIFPRVSLAQETSGKSRVLEEVIVSATRRDADLQSIPLSVSVLTDETLERLGATGFAEYARSVAGLSFTNGGTGGEKQTIRGISSNTWADLNSATAIYLDEVPMTNAGGPNGPPFNPDPMLVDIKRIEVLRGPQGTLFGSSAMGGAIRILTKQPDLSETEAELGVVASSTEDGESGYGAHAILNMPLKSLRAAVRGVAYYQDPGGFIDNLGNGQDDVNNKELLGGRLATKFSLSDDIDLTARVAYQDRQSDGFDTEIRDDERKQFHPLKESIEDEWVNYNLVVDVDLGWASLLSSTSYLDRTVNVEPDLSFLVDIFLGISNPMQLKTDEQVDEFVQEIRLVSRGEQRLSWLLGVFYQDQDQDIDQRFVSSGIDHLTGGLASMFGSPDTLFMSSEKNTLEQLALYGEVSYGLSDRIELTVGGRWYEIDRDFESDASGFLFIRGSLSESGSSTESDVTPKLSLSYTASDDLMFYGTAVEGFRPGGVNPPEGSTNPDCLDDLAAVGVAEFPNSYESDKLWNYELGTKARWLAGRVQLNAAVYHIDWSDMQTTRLLDCGAGIRQNLGEVNSDGLEVEMTLQPTANLDIFLAASYVEAELQEDVPSLRGSEGDRVPGVPRYTASLGVSYYFPAVGGREAFLHGEFQYVGKSYSDFDRASSVELESFNVTNLRAGLNSDQWSVVLFLNNVFDERGFLFARDDILGQNVTANRPRMIGLNVTRSF